MAGYYTSITIPKLIPAVTPYYKTGYFTSPIARNYSVRFKPQQFGVVGIQVYLNGIRVIPPLSSDSAWLVGNAQEYTGVLNIPIRHNTVIIMGYNLASDYAHTVDISIGG